MLFGELGFLWDESILDLMALSCSSLVRVALIVFWLLMGIDDEKDLCGDLFLPIAEEAGEGAVAPFAPSCPEEEGAGLFPTLCFGLVWLASRLELSDPSAPPLGDSWLEDLGDILLTFWVDVAISNLAGEFLFVLAIAALVILIDLLWRC